MSNEARPIVALGGGAVIATTVAGKTPTAASEIPVESSLPVQVEAGDFAGTLLEKADITVTGKIRDMMPDWATQNPFLLENWQWMGILGIIIVGKILDLFLMMFLVNVVRRIFDRRGVEFDREATRKSLRPFGLLLMGAFWWATVHLLGLPETAQAVILVAAKFIVVGAVVWSVYRLVDIFSNFMMAKAEKTKSKFDDLLIPLVRKSIKIFIALVGALFVAGNIPGLDIGSILAGLGLGGLAFALAAQDTVKNLFGSLTLLADRPFDVGDWVVIDKIEGTVEEVGIRSSRIRTFYNSVITVPNGNLITASVDNLGKRKYRRWATTLQITYDTPPDTIEAFVEGVRELIRVHPYTRKDYFHVYLKAFGAHSLDIMVYLFFLVPDWGTELRERQRIIMDILRLAERMGVEFAFPTQTLTLTRPAESSGTPELPVRNKIERGMIGGRREARKISAGGLGGLDVVPSPVNFDLPPMDDDEEEAAAEEERTRLRNLGGDNAADGGGEG